MSALSKCVQTCLLLTVRSLDPVVEVFRAWVGEQQIALDRAGGVGENLLAICSLGIESCCPLESGADPHLHQTTHILFSFVGTNR